MAHFYIGLVDRGGEGWGVTFPDLPGCTSGGKTMADLFDMSVEAVRLWADSFVADGNALAPARTIEELLDDPEVKETVDAIGPVSFIQVPLLRDAGRPVHANISLDAGLLDVIDAAARQRGLTRSAFLVSAARDKIASGS